jgi:serine/threonine-protein kinase HipA
LSPLVLDVRLDGFDDPIGYLARDERGALAFAYAPDYLNKGEALALSVSLPLAADPYLDPEARPFFDNLLQERDGVLNQVLAREQLSRDDVAGILFHIGRDCAGAVSVLPERAPPSKIPGDLVRDYAPISEARMAEIVRALHERAALPDEASDPSPLSGVQSKIALTLLPNGDFAEPKRGSGAPTTHIIKAPDRHHPRDASFEAAAMDISARFGFPTAEARVLRVGEIEVLLITRFDRVKAQDGRIVRLHQEDFAQALSLPPQLKYERNGNERLKFDATAARKVLDHTLDPESERERFAGIALFDMAIGNVDGHAKNHALIHHPGGGTIMSPRYDVMPTRLDPKLTDDFAFRIGAAKSLDVLTSQDLLQFFTTLGLKADRQRCLLEELLPSMAQAFAALFGELDRKRLKIFADLIAHNLEILCANLGLEPPPAIKTRDAFIQSGGGWRTS